MALLHGLVRLRPRLGLEIVALHLHHGLRGCAADADARFVQDACRRLGVPCEIGHVNAAAHAREAGLSLEMAARNLRYRFFGEAVARLGLSRVALAHTADDQAETVLLKLLRGAGPRGLSGMAVQAVVLGVPVIRPLLETTRREVERYLRTLGERWREDRSNRSLAFLRNRIRHELLPLLERHYNPAVRAVLCRMAQVFQEEERWLSEMAENALARAGEDRLPTEPLSAIPLSLRRRVWRLWLQRAGVPEAILDFDLIERLERLMNGVSGTVEIDVGQGWRVRHAYGTWEVLPPAGGEGEQRPLPEVPIKVPGVTVVAEWGLLVRITASRGYPHPMEPGLGRLPARVYVDAKKLSPEAIIALRPWRAGDRMAVGKGRTKKVQDLLTDARIPRPLRSRLPILAQGASILWVAGGPPSYAWRVPAPRASSWCLEMERLTQESIASSLP